MGKRLGLIIGVNNYQDPTFRSLQFAETDARALTQWLIHPRGGQWNPPDVQTVLGAEATRERVEAQLSQLCLQMATPADLILVYFAGYAFVDQVNGEGYLACSNTRYQQNASGLHLLSLVSQIMARSSAAQILCILDCCQAGSVWNMRRTSPFDFKPLLGPTLQSGLQQLQGRLLYCVCRGTETIPESSEKNLGSFMYSLVMGVGGPAIDPTNGQITLQRLHVFLADHLNEQHQPQVFGQEARPLVLVGELPTFQTGALTNAKPPATGGLLSRQQGIAPTASGIGTLAQMAPAASGISAPLPNPPRPAQVTLEQNRMQQCQQMLAQARQLIQMQEMQQAYQLVETVLQINGTLAEALILKSQILGAIGQFDEALVGVKQVVQLEPNNALGWSMAAALLANLGQLPDAMSAADRSLSLDPSNSETIAIKEMIREKLVGEQHDTGKRSRLVDPAQAPRDSLGSFFGGLGIQLLGLLLGVAGSFLLLLKPGIPVLVGFLLESIGLSLLLVNAWRGPYLYGVKRLLITLLFSLIAVAIAAGLYLVKPAYNFLLNHILAAFNLLIPLTLLALWLAAAAILPLLVSIAATITGLIVHTRRKRA